MLENNRIRLRAPEPKDIDLLYRWENNVDFWKSGNTRNPISRFALERFIAQSSENIFDTKQIRMMIVNKEDHAVVGAIDLYDFDPFHARVEVGILIDTNYQKNGFAKESLQLIKSYCFNNLHATQLYAHIPESNLASLALFRATQFDFVGILKSWIKWKNGFTDVIIMQCLNPNIKKE